MTALPVLLAILVPMVTGSAAAPVQPSDEHLAGGSEAVELSGQEHHEHGAGERSDCTAWLFEQPWASPGQWPSLLLLSTILLALSAGILLVTGRHLRR